MPAGESQTGQGREEGPGRAAAAQAPGADGNLGPLWSQVLRWDQCQARSRGYAAIPVAGSERELIHKILGDR